jgi:hypothetical protein
MGGSCWLSVIGLSGSSLLQLCLQDREGREGRAGQGRAGKGDDSLGNAGLRSGDGGGEGGGGVSQPNGADL